MSPDDFINSGLQNFTTAANWSTGTVPNSNNDADIGLASPTTVISGVSEMVDSLGTGTADVLEIVGNYENEFDLLNGTGPSANSGTVDMQGGRLSINGALSTPFVNNGILAVSDGGIIDLGDTTAGAGNIDIGADSSIYFDANETISGNVNFTGGGATLELSGFSVNFTGKISGLAATDEINFFEPVATNAPPPAWQENATDTGGTLSYSGITIELAGQYTSSDFVAQTYSITSFVSGAVIYITEPFPTIPGNNDEWILNHGDWFASAGPGSIPSGYNVAGVGDWTGKGTDGILWYDPTTGDTQEWLLNNGGWAGTVDLGTHPGNFQIAGVGDFTGNGIDDVLWTSSSGGQVQTDIWELGSNGQWIASVSPGSHPAGYQVAGIGDFTGNGTDDVLWYNPTTGDVDEWQLSNGKWAASVDLGSHPGSGWTIAGVGDFTGNGIDDVLWTNSSNGQVQTDIWELGSKGQWAASVSPGSHPVGYQVVGVGDLTGNGTSDILWQNSSTGNIDEWQITNGQWAFSVDLGTHPGNYQVAGVGDFTGDGVKDVLWHSNS